MSDKAMPCIAGHLLLVNTCHSLQEHKGKAAQGQTKADHMVCPVALSESLQLKYRHSDQDDTGPTEGAKRILTTALLHGLFNLLWQGEGGSSMAGGGGFRFIIHSYLHSHFLLENYNQHFQHLYQRAWVFCLNLVYKPPT